MSVVGHPLKPMKKNVHDPQWLRCTFPDCLEIWQADASWDHVDGGILKIHFRSNQRRPKAGQSAKVPSVFNPHSHYQSSCSKQERDMWNLKHWTINRNMQMRNLLISITRTRRPVNGRQFIRWPTNYTECYCFGFTETVVVFRLPKLLH